MIILVINCGSSSIKYQLLDMKSDNVFDLIAKGIAEKIGLPAGSAEMVKAHSFRCDLPGQVDLHGAVDGDDIVILCYDPWIVDPGKRIAFNGRIAIETMVYLLTAKGKTKF